MERLIKLKQISVENQNPNGQCCRFDHKYAKAKRKDVFNKSIERARYIKQENDWIIGSTDNLKYFILELKTEEGHLSTVKYNESCYMEELSRKEISLEELNKMFGI